jgi:acetone carboxylase gamma subunit
MYNRRENKMENKIYPLTFKWTMEVTFQNEKDIYTTVTLPDQKWATFYSQMTPEGAVFKDIVACSDGTNVDEIRKAFLDYQLILKQPLSTTLQ